MGFDLLPGTNPLDSRPEVPAPLHAWAPNLDSFTDTAEENPNTTPT